MSAIQFAPIRPVIKPVWKNKKPVCIIRTIEYSDGTKVTKTTTRESTVTRTLITPKIKQIIKEEGIKNSRPAEKEKTPIVRLCSVCEKQGHNKRTCQVTEMFGNLYI
jgi:hypothetical protein